MIFTTCANPQLMGKIHLTSPRICLGGPEVCPLSRGPPARGRQWKVTQCGHELTRHFHTRCVEIMLVFQWPGAQRERERRTDSVPLRTLFVLTMFRLPKQRSVHLRQGRSEGAEGIVSRSWHLAQEGIFLFHSSYTLSKHGFKYIYHIINKNLLGKLCRTAFHSFF